MNHRRTRILVLSLATALCGCGGGAPRMLTALYISPNPATAQNGQVQLVATGTFSSSPTSVTPLAVNWSGPAFPSANSVAPCAVGNCPTIDANGLLTCGSSYSGTFTISASAPADPKQPLDAQGVPMISATDQINCEKPLGAPPSNQRPTSIQSNPQSQSWR